MGLVLLLERVIRNSRPNHWNFKNLRSSFGREFHPPQVQEPCWFSLPPQRLFCIYTCDARGMKQLLSRTEEEKSSWAPETDTKSLRTVNEPLIQAETSPTSLGVSTCAFIPGVRAGRPQWNQRGTKLPLGCGHRRLQLWGNTVFVIHRCGEKGSSGGERWRSWRPLSFAAVGRGVKHKRYQEMWRLE